MICNVDRMVLRGHWTRARPAVATRAKCAVRCSSAPSTEPKQSVPTTKRACSRAPQAGRVLSSIRDRTRPSSTKCSSVSRVCPLCPRVVPVQRASTPSRNRASAVPNASKVFDFYCGMLSKQDTGL